MNKKVIFIGLVLVLIGAWFYMALSSLPVEEDSSPKKVIIKEGVVRTEEEVVRTLATELGFDLEGAYKTGYTNMDVIDFLIKEPHKYSVVFYKGQFYEDRITVPHLIPFSISILLMVSGVLVIILKGKAKKSS